jgi:hypothetical protein
LNQVQQAQQNERISQLENEVARLGVEAEQKELKIAQQNEALGSLQQALAYSTSLQESMASDAQQTLATQLGPLQKGGHTLCTKH